MTGKNDQTMPHRAADAIDDVMDGLKSTAHTVSESIHEAGHTVHVAAGRTARAVEVRFEEAGQLARDSVKQGRAQARAWENRLQSCVRDNLILSLLFAMGFGAVMGLMWNHKRK